MTPKKKVVQVLLKDGISLSKTAYDSEFEKQHLLYGNCFTRQSYDKFNNAYVSEIIDYKRIYKALDMPEPVEVKK